MSDGKTPAWLRTGHARAGSEQRVSPSQNFGERDDFYEQFRESPAASALGSPVLPAGVAWSPHHLAGPVHVIDGDGASLCERVSAADLVPIGSRSWHLIEPERRCQLCRFQLPEQDAGG